MLASHIKKHMYFILLLHIACGHAFSYPVHLKAKPADQK